MFLVIFMFSILFNGVLFTKLYSLDIYFLFCHIKYSFGQEQTLRLPEEFI